MYIFHSEQVIKLQFCLKITLLIFKAPDWLLKLNHSKCKVMHIGHRVQTGYYVTEVEGLGSLSHS